MHRLFTDLEHAAELFTDLGRAAELFSILIYNQLLADLERAAEFLDHCPLGADDVLERAQGVLRQYIQHTIDNIWGYD